MKPEETAKLDQSMALLIEYIPAQWWSMYSRMVDEGFTEAQAMTLLQTYIVATFNNARTNE